MKEYLLGFVTNLRKKRVSKLSLVDGASSISHFARIKPFTKVVRSSIQKYSYIGRGTAVYYAHIGSFCSIGMDCKIGLPSHTLSNISTSPLFTEKINATGSVWCSSESLSPYKDVYVGHDVWIGDDCLIMGGVKIGTGAVVGAGAIVTKDVPPYAIVAGVPARVVRYRFSNEIISLLLQSEWWKCDEEVLKRNIGHFQKRVENDNNIRNFIAVISQI